MLPLLSNINPEGKAGSTVKRFDNNLLTLLSLITNKSPLDVFVIPQGPLLNAASKKLRTVSGPPGK